MCSEEKIHIPFTSNRKETRSRDISFQFLEPLFQPSLTISNFSMNRSTMILIVLFSMVSHACVEPFDLKNIRYNNSLIVEGLITNMNQPQQIKLSRTAAINERVFIAETGA